MEGGSKRTDIPGVGVGVSVGRGVGVGVDVGVGVFVGTGVGVGVELGTVRDTGMSTDGLDGSLPVTERVPAYWPVASPTESIFRSTIVEDETATSPATD